MAVQDGNDVAQNHIIHTLVSHKMNRTIGGWRNGRNNHNYSDNIYSVQQDVSSAMDSRHWINIPIVMIGILFVVGAFTISAYAQTNTTTSASAPVAENELSQRGIATSSPVKGAHNAEAVVILPPREDGAMYEGTLSFTASRPVEVILGHRLPVDNSTYSEIDPQVFGHLRLFDTAGASDLPRIISAPSFILPDYGSSTPHFSASIPFVASAVVLGTLEDPFAAVYEV
ncbi:MAG TPA: hypothetical protein VE130_09405, partial [Nitrososphaeraceae archaeon]|nr:hypothetical protein [Nitrososphaeraceae archaeon]